MLTFLKLIEHNHRNFQDVLYIYMICVFLICLHGQLCPVFWIHPSTAVVEFYKGKIRFSFESLRFTEKLGMRWNQTMCLYRGFA